MILSILIAISLEAAAAIWALKWALPKSDAAFFSVFVGDGLLKLTALGATTWWLAAKHIPFTAPLVALGLGLMAASLLQIPFLYKAR